MSKHPLNLALRFVLEIMALVSFGIYGYQSFEGGLGVIAAVLIPLLFALAWGIFAVREDPVRSGKTIVNTPGPVRLIIELLFFGCAVAALIAAGHRKPGLIFGIVVFLHYLLSMDRIRWLMNH